MAPSDISAVINELASAENGAVVFSSATGRQYALENSEWGNGAFTKGLVEGISGKADYRGTGRITVNMLDLYISERVKELTRASRPPPRSSRPTYRIFLSMYSQDHSERPRRQRFLITDPSLSRIRMRSQQQLSNDVKTIAICV